MFAIYKDADIQKVIRYDERKRRIHFENENMISSYPFGYLEKKEVVV